MLLNWIFVWCFTISQQQRRELTFRISQLKAILARLTSEYEYVVNADLFFLLMETCYNHGVSYEQAHSIYEALEKWGALQDNRVRSLHFQH